MKRRVATSKTTPYHLFGDDQVERYNGVIWNASRLALRSANLPDSRLELVKKITCVYVGRRIITSMADIFHRFLSISRPRNKQASKFYAFSAQTDNSIHSQILYNNYDSYFKNKKSRCAKQCMHSYSIVILPT